MKWSLLYENIQHHNLEKKKKEKKWQYSYWNAYTEFSLILSCILLIISAIQVTNLRGLISILK